MRSTVTLDDDIARELKALQHRSQPTFKETLNHVQRRGLAATEPLAADPPFTVQPFDGGFAPDVDSHKLNQLLDEIDADELLARGGR